MAQKLSFKTIFNCFTQLITINLFSIIISYDSSLLKINYFYDNTKLCYVNAMTNSKGDLYLEYCGPESGYRYFYTLDSKTGEEIFFNGNKIRRFSIYYGHTYHESIFIKENNEENYIFSFSPSYIDFFNLKTGTSSYQSSSIIDEKSKSRGYLNTPSIKNTILKLKNGNYFLTFIRYTDIRYQQHFALFNFNQENIGGFNKIHHIDETINQIRRTAQCFQTKNEYIECIFTRLLHPGYIEIIVLDSNLKEVGRALKLITISRETFVKIFHIKNEIGGYLYFNTDTNLPVLEIKTLNLGASPILQNQFGFNSITLDGNGLYKFSDDLFLTDITKINDDRFSIILTESDLSHILICLFDIYNNDDSIKLRYFNLDLSKKDIKISDNIRSFLYNENIGLAFYNSKSEFPGYILFGYPNVTRTNEFILFADENETEYYFSLLENIEISNNIFGNKLIKIKVKSFNDSSVSGIFLYSSNNNDILKIEQDLEINDTIIFKESKDEANIGIYILDLIPIIQTPTYEEFESLADQQFYSGQDQLNFYEDKIYNSKIIRIYYIKERKCELAFHKHKITGEKKCYEFDKCYLQDYKYYLDDKKQCISSKCPIDYYNFNFQCYKEQCPIDSNSLSNSKICDSIYNYCIVNEYYQTICSNTPFDGYKYKFDSSKQYLRSCNDSLIYTINEVKTYLFNNTCYIKCPENTIKDEENGICICKFYKYEMNDDYICYSRKEGCPNKISVVDLKECVDDINECINNGYKIFYDQCYKDNCPDNSYYDENEQIYKCNWLHYTDSLTNDIKCSSDKEICPEGYPYERISTHECLNNCSYTELLNDSVKINNIKGSMKNIKENLKNIFDDENYNNKDTIIRGKNVTFEIYSTKNDTQYEDISSLNLRSCYEKLLENPKLDYIYIFKIDYKETFPPRIEYEILDPDNKTGLDLSECQGLKAYIDIPLDFKFLGKNITDLIPRGQKHNYDMFNKKDKFYHDICTPFTSYYNTDMLLYDRILEMFDIANICKNDCEYYKYDNISKRITCDCPINSNISDTVEVIKFDKNDMKSFLSIKTYANFAVLKCYKLTFSKLGQEKNYGSFLLIFLIIIYIFLMGAFYHKYEFRIKKTLFSALGENLSISSNDLSIKKSNTLDDTKKEKSKIITIEKSNEIKSCNNYDVNDLNLNSSNTKDSKSSIMRLPMKNEKIIEKIKKNNIHNLSEKTKIIYNDEEINSLEYDEALVFDHRSFLQNYFSLIKRKNSLIFTFYVKDDFNILIIKIALFIFSFSLYFVINTLFFKDETIHKIFEVKGKFDIVYHVPQIIYSTIISVIINKIMKTLALSEADLIKIRKYSPKKIYEELNKMIRCLKIKINIFWPLSLLFMLFFWYYIACFCAVFQNTQRILIKDIILSFILSLIYPFGLSLLPIPLRLISLHNKQKKRNWLYKLSNYIALI